MRTRLYVKTIISFLSYDMETTRTTYQVLGTRYLYSSSTSYCYGAAVVDCNSRYPDRTAVPKGWRR